VAGEREREGRDANKVINSEEMVGDLMHGCTAKRQIWREKNKHDYIRARPEE
jgi:hypothetical protein